jgi:hypothetical protein
MIKYGHLPSLGSTDASKVFDVADTQIFIQQSPTTLFLIIDGTCFKVLSNHYFVNKIFLDYKLFVFLLAISSLKLSFFMIPSKKRKVKAETLVKA